MSQGELAAAQSSDIAQRQSHSSFDGLAQAMLGPQEAQRISSARMKAMSRNAGHGWEDAPAGRLTPAPSVAPRARTLDSTLSSGVGDQIWGARTGALAA